MSGSILYYVWAFCVNFSFKNASMPTQFVEGPAGTGKTTSAIQHIRRLLDQGVSPATVLVLVPQRTLGQPYQMAFVDPDWPQGGLPDVVTLGGLARRGLETFWPLVSDQMGFANPARREISA